MKKRPFSDIERIIAEAANSHEAGYEELSWQKMEALLSSNRRRRKPFAFWFLLLFGLLLVGGFFIWKSNQHPNASQQINIPQIDDRKLAGNKIPVPLPDKVVPAESDKNLTPPVAAKPGVNVAATRPLSQAMPGIQIASRPAVKKLRDNIKGRVTMEVNSDPLTSQKAITPTNETAQPQLLSNESTEKDITKATKNDITKATEPSPSQTLAEDITVTDSLNKGKPIQPSQQSGAPAKRQQTQVLQKIYFTVAGGVESNGTGLLSGGQTTARFGAGLGYQVSNKLSLQVGFYNSTKKYVAGPGAYKAVPGSYWSTVDIRQVDASCSVYEIPLSMQFEFSPGKKLQWFAIGGLSSYIMKKEDYSYFYYRGSNPYTAKASYTGNQHFLSVARLSAGVAYRIMPALSLTAAPAVSIPLRGVGEGAMKLYSTELMLGLTYKPWFKKR